MQYVTVWHDSLPVPGSVTWNRVWCLVAGCCRVLQCVLQDVIVRCKYCNKLLHPATQLQCVAGCNSALQYVTVWHDSLPVPGSVMWNRVWCLVAGCCRVLQCVAVCVAVCCSVCCMCCSVLQCSEMLQGVTVCCVLKCASHSPSNLNYLLLQVARIAIRLRLSCSVLQGVVSTKLIYSKLIWSNTNHRRAARAAIGLSVSLG